MRNAPISRLSFEGIDRSFQAGMSGQVHKMQFEPETKPVSFKDTLAEVVGSVNGTVQAPDEMMHAALTTGAYDVHDVMIANAKSELAVNITTQVATKVIQAYDKILQIQI